MNYKSIDNVEAWFQFEEIFRNNNFQAIQTVKTAKHIAEIVFIWKQEATVVAI